MDTKYNENNSIILIGFDKDGEIIDKNFNFNKYFPHIKNKNEFDDKKIKIIGDFSQNKAVLQSDVTEELVNFDKLKSKLYTFYIGRVYSYEDIIKTLSENKIKKEHIEISKKISDLYGTVIVDKNYRVTFSSRNLAGIFGREVEAGDNLKNHLKEDVIKIIDEKIEYLDLVEDMSIEFDDMMVVISKLTCGFLSINIYPFTTKVFNKFDEISSLHAKVEALEDEIKQKNLLIKFQKNIILKLTRDKMMDCNDDCAYSNKKNYSKDEECGSKCFINIGLEKTLEEISVDEIECKMEKLASNISSVMDKSHERIFDLGNGNLGLLLKYPQEEISRKAVEKYENIFEEISKKDNLQLRIIKTNVTF